MQILQQVAENIQHVRLRLHCLNDILENEPVFLCTNVTRLTHSLQGAGSDQVVFEQCWNFLIQRQLDELVVEVTNSTHSSIFSSTEE